MEKYYQKVRKKKVEKCIKINVKRNKIVQKCIENWSKVAKLCCRISTNWLEIFIKMVINYRTCYKKLTKIHENAENLMKNFETSLKICWNVD